MPQLSCEQCRDRKTKCDKQSPCSACKTANLPCRAVLRARLPRGRSGKAQNRKHALEGQLDRLELLLQRVADQKPTVKNTSSRSDDTPMHHAAQREDGSEEFDGMIAPNFWKALAEEVSGIRKILHESDDEDDAQTSMGSSPTSESLCQDKETESTPMSLIFNGTGHVQQTLQPLEKSPAMRDILLNAYGARVDTIFKPFHWPSVRTLLVGLEDNTENDNKPLNALASSIYYMSICSFNEDECISIFRRPKSELVNDYRRATESRISSARVFYEPNLTGLQAFVLYLHALRACRGHALNWTLLAIAVRLATALGLDKTSRNSASVLDVEVSRRLWYTICLMDLQATLDRGSAPIIQPDQLGPRPKDCDDSKILLVASSDDQAPGFTDMTFCTMTYKAMTCFRKISATPNDTKNDWPNWKKKVQLFNDLEQDFKDRYYLISMAAATPIQLLVSISASTILADIRLLLRRPAYRQYSTPSAPPWDNFSALVAATESLEGHMNIYANHLAPWAWKEWTPWYAMAVALAELCKTPTGPIADRAFSAATAMSRTYAPPPGDLEQGPLWKPIRKLLRRVTNLRERASQTVVTPEPRLRSQGLKNGQSHNPLYPASCENTNNISVELDWMNWQELSNPTLSPFPNLHPDTTFPSIDLRPETGVSWLDWDLILPESEMPFDCTLNGI